MKTYSELLKFCQSKGLEFEVNPWTEPFDSIYAEPGERLEMGTYFGIRNLANRKGRSEWNWTWFKSYDKKGDLTDDSTFSFVERYSMNTGTSHTGVKEMMKAYFAIV